jgi:hypothetical protein
MTVVNVRSKLNISFSIATVLCLLSTHVVAEQMRFRCRGYSIDVSKEPFTFTVTIDRDRNLVMDIRAGNGMASSSGSIVETIVISETTITATQRLWPAAERILNINLATGQFDLKISNGGLKYVKGICAPAQGRNSGAQTFSRADAAWSVTKTAVTDRKRGAPPRQSQSAMTARRTLVHFQL